MLHYKDINKLSELKGLFKNKTKPFTCIMNYIQLFDVQKIKRIYLPEKKKGYLSEDIVSMLIMLPLFSVSTVNSLLYSVFSSVFCAAKDTYYRFKNNADTNWRKILLNFAKRSKMLAVKHATELQNTVKCFIVDDTDLEKTGATFEGISRIYNHVTRKSILGFKCLALVFWDGKGINPIDFSLHNERGKKKNYGLSKSELRNRFTKQRETRQPGYKRKKELRMKKTDNVLKMVKRAIKHGFKADYLLCDSWFFSEKLLEIIREIKGGIIHIIGMCRMDKRKYNLVNGEELTAKEILNLHKKKRKYSRKTRVYYIAISVHYKAHPVTLFFCKNSKRTNWRLLISTNNKLNFNQVLEIYQIRWGIEVFFKECKQYLGLGKCQSTDFDSQIADTTLVMIQYIILNLYKRFESYETMGQIFAQSKSEVLSLTLAERIWGLFIEIQNMIVDVFELDIDVEEIMSKMITQSEYEKKLLTIFSTLKNEVEDTSLNKAA